MNDFTFPEDQQDQGEAVAQALRSFNPNEHLVQLKSKAGSMDYLPVQWRLVWFRSVCPQGTIDTEEVFVDLDRECEAEAFVWNAEKRRSEKIIKQAKGYARFKAVVTDGKGGRATATGSESAVDFPDYIEKAETKAVGRALAALGYGTQFAPEFGENNRIVDSPADLGRDQGERRPAPAPQGGQGQGERRPAPAPAPADQDQGEGRPLPPTRDQLNAIKNLQAQLVALGGEPTGEVPQTHGQAARQISLLTSDIKLAQRAAKSA